MKQPIIVQIIEAIWLVCFFTCLVLIIWVVDIFSPEGELVVRIFFSLGLLLPIAGLIALITGKL